MASISTLSFLFPFKNIVSSKSPKQSKPKPHHASKLIMARSSEEEEKASSSSHISGNRRRDVLIGLAAAAAAAATITGTAHATETSRSNSSSVEFPITLDSSVSVVVKRPKKSRSRKEKEEEEEVLVVDGIEFDRNKAVKFDVVLNCEDDDISQIGPKNQEFAGSFVSLPHGGNKKIVTRLRLCLTDLLQDLEADDQDTVLVTLVPRIGTGLVSVKGINIELVAE